MGEHPHATFTAGTPGMGWLLPTTLGNMEFGCSFLWSSMKIKFVSFWVGDGILRILIPVLLPIFTPSCPLEVEIGESPDKWYIHNTTVTPCVFLRHLRHLNNSLSEQEELSFLSKSIACYR